MPPPKRNKPTAEKTGKKRGPKKGSKAGGRSEGRSGKASGKGKAGAKRGHRRGPEAELKKAQRFPRRRRATQQHEPETESFAGRLRVTSDGSGRLENPDKPGESHYVPPEGLGGARHGDLVEARLEVGRKGRMRAYVTRITASSDAPLIGSVYQDKDQWWIQPRGEGQALKIEADPQLKPGLVVRAHFNTESDEGMLRLASIVGAAESPLTRLALLLEEFDLPEGFSKDTLAQARAFAEDLSDVLQAEPDGMRRDLRDLPLVTIDGEDARDFDDAVYAEAEGTKTKVWVAIADVGSYVTEGSPLDSDALQRTTSTYFPHRVIPMLPERLSNGLCSLRPEVDRLALACTYEVDAKGGRSKIEVFPALIRSHARLTYAQVQSFLQGVDQRSITADITASLKALRAGAQRLREARAERGAIELDIPEAHVVLNKDQIPTHVRPRLRFEAHKMVEDLMLGANESVAEYCLDEGIPVLFRAHEPPSGDAVGDLVGWLKRQGLQVTPEGLSDPKKFQQLRNEALAKESEALKDKEASWLDEEGTPTAPTFVTDGLALRAMSQARYTEANLGHFALASKAYLHFTSPIRRYPDLVVHRALWRHFRKQSPQKARLDQWSLLCSAGERRAIKAERKVVAWMAAVVASEHVGELYSSTIVGAADFGLFVRPDAIFVEGMVPVQQLPPESAYFEYERERMALVSRQHQVSFAVGDRVAARIVAVDIDSTRVEFLIEEEGGAERRAPAPQGFERMRRERKRGHDAPEREGRGRDERGRSSRGRSGRGGRSEGRDEGRPRRGSAQGKRSDSSRSGRPGTRAGSKSGGGRGGSKKGPSKKGRGR